MLSKEDHAIVLALIADCTGRITTIDEFQTLYDHLEHTDSRVMRLEERAQPAGATIFHRDHPAIDDRLASLEGRAVRLEELTQHTHCHAERYPHPRIRDRLDALEKYIPQLETLPKVTPS